MTKKRDMRPILVPVDFSAHSEAALAFAAELATLMRVPLAVLHVVHDPGEAPGFYAGKRGESSLVKMEDVAAQMMEEFIAQFVANHPDHKTIHDAQTILKVGLPVTRILEVAQGLDARMVVMGSRGRTGLAHILLGSKAEQVVRLCPFPVTIVKNGEVK